MDFEWDEAKRLSNLDEHGVDFEDAALIFDGGIVEAEDTREEYGERRFRALGQFSGQYYMVAYTWRGTTRRLISAWKVDDGGKRRYSTILSRGT